MQSDSKIQIMIVEDHPPFREVLELSLAEEADMELAGKFGAAEVALRHLQDSSIQVTVDVILLDLNLPKISGLEAIPWFRQYTPKTKIIVLTQSDERADVLEAIQAGAAGYLLKSASIEEITEGIRTVISGGASLDSQVAQFIMEEIQPTKRHGTTTEIEFTPREMDILVLLSEGLVKKEIAEKLKISTHTVAEYVKRIYLKLDATNAPSAISKAYQAGVFLPEK